MQSYKSKQIYWFRVDANALGGFLNEPIEKIISALAPVSLPAVGGFATARSGAFNLDGLISCASAYTRVSGREHADGSISIQAAAVVEDLNILEVVRAERIVAQLSISTPRERWEPTISIAGSAFEGLRVAGQDCRVSLNTDFLRPLTGQGVRDARQHQGERLANRKESCRADVHEWVLKRYPAVPDAEQRDRRVALCSLVEGVEGAGAYDCCGPVVDIAGFGTILLGELLVAPDYVQLVAIRADLGCPVNGAISICAPGGGGMSGDD
jgi:hypothetical protein